MAFSNLEHRYLELISKTSRISLECVCGGEGWVWVVGVVVVVICLWSGRGVGAGGMIIDSQWCTTQITCGPKKNLKQSLRANFDVFVCKISYN